MHFNVNPNFEFHDLNVEGFMRIVLGLQVMEIFYGISTTKIDHLLTVHTSKRYTTGTPSLFWVFF